MMEKIMTGVTHFFSEMASLCRPERKRRISFRKPVAGTKEDSDWFRDKVSIGKNLIDSEKTSSLIEKAFGINEKDDLGDVGIKIFFGLIGAGVGAVGLGVGLGIAGSLAGGVAGGVIGTLSGIVAGGVGGLRFAARKMNK